MKSPTGSVPTGNTDRYKQKKKYLLSLLQCKHGFCELLKRTEAICFTKADNNIGVPLKTLGLIKAVLISEY